MRVRVKERELKKKSKKTGHKNYKLTYSFSENIWVGQMNFEREPKSNTVPIKLSLSSKQNNKEYDNKIILNWPAQFNNKKKPVSYKL